jgi:MinD superfamily P-loop ATPase
MVMESIKNADYCVLVAEPTTFGAHNLEMVAELAEIFEKPVGCVLNKCLGEENPSEQFCIERGIPIIGRLAFDKDLGLLNSSGEIVSNKDTAYAETFASILKYISDEVNR